MTVNLSILGGAGWQFFDSNGVPLAGGKIYTYTAGTTTLAATYTTSAGNVANTNPIILDSAGRVTLQIWLTTSSAYKFVLKTSADVDIWTKDNISGPLDFNFVNELAATTGAGLVGYSNALSYPANTVGSSILSREDHTPPEINFTFTWGSNAQSLAGQLYTTTFVPSGAKPIFGVYSDFVTDSGFGVIPYQVGSFTGLDLQPGTGNAYTVNDLMQLNAGTGHVSCTVQEINLNNFGDYNSGDNVNDNNPLTTTGDWVTMSNFISTGTTRLMAVQFMGAPAAAGQLFNRGISFSDSYRLNFIDGTFGGVSLIRATGSASGAVIDISEVTSNEALLIKNDSSIASLNAAGAVAALLRFNPADGLLVGEGATTGVIVCDDLFTNTDNSHDIGSIPERWKTIYLVNAPSVTSDPATKDELAAADTALAMDMLRGVNPITWRFKVGGVEQFEVEAEELVPLVKKVASERSIVELVDGKLTERTVTEYADETVTEDVPVFDEAGNPVFYTPTDSKTGEPAINRNTGKPYGPVHKTMSRPVMVSGKVKKYETREVPGKRTHIGFNAEEIEQFLQERGLDWGLVVRDKDAPLQLRESRLIAPLWAAVQQMDKRLQAIEEKLKD